MSEATGFSQERAGIYDRMVWQMIPGYEVLHKLSGVILAQDLPETASILVAGSGTGTEILGWGQMHPQWRFTAVEPSQAMTSMAQEKLKQANLDGRVVFKTGTVDQLPEGEAYDAATLLLVLHFLSDDGAKAALLEAIAERLKPGAPFLMACRFGNKESTRFKKMTDINKAWALDQGMSPKEAGERFSPARQDLHDVPEERVKNLLRDAGFIDVQRYYQAAIVGAWLARAPR